MSGGLIIIDRRKNPKAKNLSNRQRFVERAQRAIRESAKKALGKKSITDYSDVDVNISTDGISEPHFRHDPSEGHYDYVLPGNQEYIVGDKIKKPQKQGGKGKGKGGNGGEGGEDDFEFALSYDEYLDIIFDDLELPDLIKKTEKNAVAFKNQRAGYTNNGNPSNLNVEKTAIAGMARRIALKAPKFKRIHELEAERDRVNDQINAIEDGWKTASGEMDILRATDAQMTARERLVDRLASIDDEIKALRARANAVSYLDNVDLRYNNFIKVPKPITQAVMFCVLDVSFSMGEREKIIAKKFFVLLHLFLMRRYENIDVVFIRHHDKAVECDENEFFTSREGGGTTVSTAYEKMKEIMAARYNSEDWNVYLAQASDGDNSGSDNEKVKELLADILPTIQHFTYIQIEDDDRRLYMDQFGMATYNLWHAITYLAKIFANISCAQISDELDVVPVFRNLFKKENQK